MTTPRMDVTVTLTLEQALEIRQVLEDKGLLVGFRAMLDRAISAGARSYEITGPDRDMMAFMADRESR